MSILEEGAALFTEEERHVADVDDGEVNALLSRSAGLLEFEHISPRRLLWACFREACKPGGTNQTCATNAVMVIAYHHDAGQASELMHILCHSNEEHVRHAAQVALGIADKSSSEGLGNQGPPRGDTPVPGGRSDVVRLGQSRDYRAIDPLLRIFRETRDDELATLAVRAIGSLMTDVAPDLSDDALESLSRVADASWDVCRVEEDDPRANGTQYIYEPVSVSAGGIRRLAQDLRNERRRASMKAGPPPLDERESWANDSYKELWSRARPIVEACMSSLAPFSDRSACRPGSDDYRGVLLRHPEAGVGILEGGREVRLDFVTLDGKQTVSVAVDFVTCARLNSQEAREYVDNMVRSVADFIERAKKNRRRQLPKK